MSTNDKLFWQMFIQFLQTQASVWAPQASHIKSKCTPDPEVFTGEGSSIDKFINALKTLKLVLALKWPSTWTACLHLKHALPTSSHALLEQLKVTLHIRSRPSTTRIEQMFFKTSRMLFWTLIQSSLLNVSSLSYARPTGPLLSFIKSLANTLLT